MRPNARFLHIRPDAHFSPIHGCGEISGPDINDIRCRHWLHCHQSLRSAKQSSTRCNRTGDTRLCGANFSPRTPRGIALQYSRARNTRCGRWRAWEREREGRRKRWPRRDGRHAGAGAITIRCQSGRRLSHEVRGRRNSARERGAMPVGVVPGGSPETSPRDTDTAPCFVFINIPSRYCGSGSVAKAPPIATMGDALLVVLPVPDALNHPAKPATSAPQPVFWHVALSGLLAGVRVSSSLSIP